MNKTVRVTLFAVLFYVAFALLVWVALDLIPAGPCDPGGVAFVLLLPLLALILGAISWTKFSHGKRHFLPAILLHALVLLGCIVVYVFVM